MKIVVYVEGPSDQFAMEALLREVIRKKAQQGVSISFVPCPKGNARKYVVETVPTKAANAILNDPDIIIAVIPDLHPKSSPDQTHKDLFATMHANFRRALQKRGSEDERNEDRFFTFCFKHDLEALILASELALKIRLNCDSFKVRWRVPVEDQDDEDFPKKVVQRLFLAHDNYYVDTVDAPQILGVADLSDVVKACPQCFGPFVDFLQSFPNTLAEN